MLRDFFFVRSEKYWLENLEPIQQFGGAEYIQLFQHKSSAYIYFIDLEKRETQTRPQWHLKLEHNDGRNAAYHYIGAIMILRAENLKMQY